MELDEVIFAGNHEQANIMKALTTEPKGTKEEKHAKKICQRAKKRIGETGRS
eukprot:COSAG01_NODE_1701_length_9447_cov_3.223363_2_plen_52_part_00